MRKHYVYMAPNEDRGDDLPGEDEVDQAALDAIKAQEEADKLEAELKAEKKEPKAEDEEKKKDTRIPLSRHKEILEKEREQRATLEAQLAQYQKGQTIAEVNKEITALEQNVLKLEKEYAAAIVDGKTDDAAALMSQIRKAERDMAESKSDMKIQAAEIRATERARYNVALERIESTFPVLNPDDDAYDQAVMDEVAELKEAYQLKGLTPTAALQKAVKLIVGASNTKQEVATTSQPRVNADQVAAERKSAAVKKTADAMNKTPPAADKIGEPSDKMGGGKVDAAAVMKMSQKDFAALNEETLAQLRGDTV